jgi:hypothetical protein
MGELLPRLVLTDGSAAHPHCRRLLGPPSSLRDLSDVVHALCAVHGDHPGVADEVLSRSADSPAADWLAEVAQAMTQERGYLAQLVAAAGPLPSTPGQDVSEAALIAQRHALAMLARSERGGCALGAVAALVLDWTSIRRLLDVAADRFAVGVAPRRLPDVEETLHALALCASPAVDRAVAFGAQQLLAQHRGLWDLMEARAGART